MDKRKILNDLNKRMHNTMLSTIGIEITDVGDNFICGRMPVDERTIQPLGMLHGGASVTLAESLGSIAGSLQIDSEKEVVMGIQINANHLNPVEKGWVIGRATPVKVGKRIQVWEIEIKNEKNKAVCISQLTLAVVKKR